MASPAPTAELYQPPDGQRPQLDSPLGQGSDGGFHLSLVPEIEPPMEMMGRDELMLRASRIVNFVDAELDLLRETRRRVARDGWAKVSGEAVSRTMSAHERQSQTQERIIESQPGGEILALAAVLIGAGVVTKESA